jgi:glycopeptide antibiotics resistance protein
MSQSLKPALRRSLLDALLILSILLILIVTLLPQHGLGGRRVSLVPFHDISQAVRDSTVKGNGLLTVLGNLLLFTHFGFVGAIRWASLARLPRMAILVALSSSMLELVQFFMGGRSSSIDDVILNTAGEPCSAWRWPGQAG